VPASFLLATGNRRGQSCTDLATIDSSSPERLSISRHPLAA
jgi:hypothetical protein